MTNKSKIIIGIGSLVFLTTLVVGLSDSDTTSSSYSNVTPVQSGQTGQINNISAPIIDEIQATSNILGKPEKNCHPSYSGCLNPNASDYDCAGGSGNGPYYTGKVQVMGNDVYGLDRDKDGWGCE